MSNPSPVCVISDDLATFLARTNQFGETNAELIQQKFNKKVSDGASLPIFAALESRSRALAQWANMVDDHLLAFYTAALGVNGLSTLGPSNTTDATPTSLFTALTGIASGAVGWVHAKIWGKKATQDFVFQEIRARFESDGAALTTDTDYNSGPVYSAGGTLTTASALLGASGTDVRVTVTGEAATTIAWQVAIQTFVAHT